MEELIKIGFDLDDLSRAFNIQKKPQCSVLSTWLDANYTLTEFEQRIIDDLHEEMETVGDYWNEEELKIQFVGSIFYVARVNEKNRIRVFYERPLSAIIGRYSLSVICDCLVATPSTFNAPQQPYFFLQEFKKAKSEKRDPEAQMLMAMIIAAHANADEKPIYGGYLIGSDWRFTTLINGNYCVSRKYDATRKEDIEKMVSILRHLKTLIMSH